MGYAMAIHERSRHLVAEIAAVNKSDFVAADRSQTVRNGLRPRSILFSQLFGEADRTILKKKNTLHLRLPMRLWIVVACARSLFTLKRAPNSAHCLPMALH